MLKLRDLLPFVLLVVLLLPAIANSQSVYIKDETAGVLNQPTLPSKTVVLTFDDGPSEYTPEVLEILREKQVKATFFVVGSQAVQHKLLKQIYDEGHEIGNHTYTHLDLSKAPNWRMKLELNITRIIITSQTNHSTRLFRPPLLGSDALTPEARSIVNKAADLGYITVGETIDSEDWRKPGTQKLIANATDESGGIILLHDGGGDRSQTVKTLPEIIDYYQKHDYKFMTINQALGISRQDVMPALSTTDRLLAILAKVVITAVSWIGTGLRWFIIILIVASFGRFFIVTVAALIQSRRKFKLDTTENLPCSILIPAYNESAVIQSCLKSVLASNYTRFEVLVIDDGSKDNTYELANEVQDPRLRVLRKENGGKASALNYGIAEARAPFLIAIDADTVFRTRTIAKLMRHFANPRVGAVSGNTKIVNRHKLITKLQSLEYIVGFNLDRRMGDLFDCITVVPGAVGAFRKSAINRIGGFTFDTLAEDTDLTLSIKETGYKIVYDAEAVALTEAPATIRDLLKQRFRWTFGTMQAIWKHKRSFLNPRRGSLGMIGLPYLLFFQIIFPLFSPLFDLALIIGLINHHYKLMVVSFVVYTVVDILTAAIALRLDSEKLRNLWILIPQRILYRQLMYYVIVRSFINVLRGRLVHWGKLERKGTHLAKSL
ncbi:MAG: glycosyltransferase [Patescibacteria group bacterium]